MAKGSNNSREIGVRLSVKDKELVERALKSVGAEGEAALKRIQRSAAPTSTSLVALNRASVTLREGMRGLAGGIVAGLIPTLSLVAALNGAKNAMAEFGEIADRSKSAGLDPEYFQGLAYKAKLAGIEIGEVASTLDAFNKNSELAENRKGSLFKQLSAVNPELLKSIQLADTQQERIAVVADAIENAADKAGLAAAIFGDIGPRFAAVFEGGAAEIDRTIAKAKELGLVVDRDTIAKADELGDKFDTVSQILDLKFKSALIALAPYIVSFAQSIADMATALSTFVSRFEDLKNLSKPQLEERLRTLGSEDVSMENTIIGYQQRIAAGQELPGIGVPALQQQIAKLREQRARNQEEQRQVLALLAQLEATPALGTGTSEDSEGGGGHLPDDPDAIRLADQRRKAIADLTAKLREQLAALGMTNREQAIQNALSQAHITAADQEAAGVSRLAGELFDQKEALKASNEAASFFADTMADAFEGLVDGSKSAEDAIGDVAKAIQKASIEAVLLGRGPLAGLFGSQSQTSGPGGLLGGLLSGLLQPNAATGGTLGNGLWGSAIFNAKGNVYGGGLSDLSNSIVRSRTPFYFGKGAGVMGERGAEAILPLMRDAKGRLGVAGGSSGPEVAVNVQIIKGGNEDRVEQSRGPNGRVDIKAFIASVTNENIAAGRHDSLMASTFGVRRKGV